MTFSFLKICSFNGLFFNVNKTLIDRYFSHKVSQLGIHHHSGKWHWLGFLLIIQLTRKLMQAKINNIISSVLTLRLNNKVDYHTSGLLQHLPKRCLQKKGILILITNFLSNNIPSNTHVVMQVMSCENKENW